MTLDQTVMKSDRTISCFRVMLMTALTVSLVFGLVISSGAAAETPLNVAFLWHQHQPLYIDPTTGEAQLPWVRMHAIKDYYDMAAILQRYPDIKATFNLVPSLIDQLQAYINGETVDLYQKMARTPAEQLSDDEKAFLLRRFFDANWEKVIARFPRYKELLDLRGSGASDAEIKAAMERFSTQDYRDLQVWFDLAWFDPDFLTDDPELRALVQKGRGFIEADKEIIREKQLAIMQSIIPLHREMQQSGQIEIITTPYAHPIIPLLYDGELARIASPDLHLPARLFAYPQDIERHLSLGVQNYQKHFASKPKGLWPSEQAVSKYIIPHVARAGFHWMVSSEGVLAKSLGVQLRGISGVVVRPDLLYQPYVAEWEGERVTILFRDIVLSDRVGFEYSGMSGRQAADDLITYLHRVRRSLGETAGEKIVLIALDGENAWEHYPNDGKEFFHALYAQLSADPLLRTVTISEYLEQHPATAVLDDLWTGSWIGDHLETWIGESEENVAWEQLALARAALEEFALQHGDDPDPKVQEAIERAWRSMIAAQGSDWFWWYGDDQDSSNDEAFDRLFRLHLQGVYQSLGLDVPTRLLYPIVAPQPAVPVRAATGLSAPRPDGWADPGEWDAAALYLSQQPGGMRTGTESLPHLEALYLAVDPQHLTVRVQFDQNARELIGHPVELLLYFDHPRREHVNELTRYGGIGGYPIAYEVRLDFESAPRGVRPTVRVSAASGDGEWAAVTELRQTGLGSAFEIRIPFEELDFQPGETLRVTAILAAQGVEIDRLPGDGPALVFVPTETEGTLIFRMDDPIGDDYGAGSVTYPTNDVFSPGVFDLSAFEVYETENDVIFHVQFHGPIENVWSSPIGLSVQTIDIYIDTDRVADSGSTEALAGRRVSIAQESAWEYAIWVEGWYQKLFMADGSESSATVRAVTDPISRRVTIQVPKNVIGAPSPDWGYIVMILGQEGFPASDSLRVREVMRQAQEWRFGGGDDGPFDPNVIDLLARPGVQEESLSDYDVAARRLAAVGAVYP